MPSFSDLEKRIKSIERRNARVEKDKAWETSWMRKISIAILTYLVTSLYFYFADIGDPFINAVVPTLGFLLSTLGLNFIKNLWLNSQDR